MPLFNKHGPKRAHTVLIKHSRIKQAGHLILVQIHQHYIQVEKCTRLTADY